MLVYFSIAFLALREGSCAFASVNACGRNDRTWMETCGEPGEFATLLRRTWTFQSCLDSKKKRGFCKVVNRLLVDDFKQLAICWSRIQIFDSKVSRWVRREKKRWWMMMRRQKLRQALVAVYAPFRVHGVKCKNIANIWYIYILHTCFIHFFLFSEFPSFLLAGAGTNGKSHGC